MAKLETRKVETVYVLELTQAEMEALYNGISVDRSRFVSPDQYVCIIELNDLIGGALK